MKKKLLIQTGQGSGWDQELLLLRVLAMPSGTRRMTVGWGWDLPGPSARWTPTPYTLTLTSGPQGRPGALEVNVRSVSVLKDF